MDRLKAIVVDDEQAACNVLCNLLKMSKIEVEVVAVRNNVLDAVKAIKDKEPDLVFLDIQMPEYVGYEIVKFFDQISFEIVFVTAYDQYAIKAFELNAIDYIVKPIERNRLDEALQKVQNKRKREDQIEKYQLLLDSMSEDIDQSITISELSGGQVCKRVLRTKDIISIEAKGAYSNIHLLNESSVLVSRNLTYFESLLPEESPFFRSHRSWLLNLNHVLDFKPRLGEVGMNNNITARISRSQIKAFEAQV